MQQKWDDLDCIIKNSFKDIDTKANYNKKLLCRLHGENNGEDRNYKRSTCNRNNYSSVAVSLILTGFLLIFVNASNISYKIADIEYKIRYYTAQLNYQHNSNFNIIENLFGE